MLKKSVFFGICLILCLSVSAVNAENGIVSQKSVSPEEIYLYGSGCTPDKTTVTIEVSGYGGGDLSDTLAFVLAIDSSTSMYQNDSSYQRIPAARAFVDMMAATPENDIGGMVSFDNDIDIAYGLVTESLDSFGTLKSKIGSVDASGPQSLNVGLNASIAMLDADAGGVKKVIILLTDGYTINTLPNSYTPSGSPGSLADDAAAKGIAIYTIGLNVPAGSAAESDLVEIAVVTGGAYFPCPDAAGLEATFAAVYTCAACTAPYNVDLVECTHSYIVGEGEFSIIPDAVIENDDGTTEMRWTNISQHVGNKNSRLDASEIFIVTFTAGSDQSGEDLPVEIPVRGFYNPELGLYFDDFMPSYFSFTDPHEGFQEEPSGQVCIDVIECVQPTQTASRTPTQTPTATPPTTPASVPEFPVVLLPLGSVIVIFAVALVLRR